MVKGMLAIFLSPMEAKSFILGIQTASGDSCQEPEEVLHGCAPDVCLVDTTMPAGEWSVFQTTLCKMK